MRKPISTPEFISCIYLAFICLVKDIVLQGECGKEKPKGLLLFYFWPSCLEFPHFKNIFWGKPKQCAKINTPKGNELELTFASSCSLFPAISATFSKMAHIHPWSCYQSRSWFHDHETPEWGGSGLWAKYWVWQIEIRDARYKRMHLVWFYIHEILDQAKCYVQRTSQWRLRRGTWENFLDEENALYLD